MHARERVSVPADFKRAFPRVSCSRVAVLTQSLAIRVCVLVFHVLTVTATPAERRGRLLKRRGRCVRMRSLPWCLKDFTLMLNHFQRTDSSSSGGGGREGGDERERKRENGQRRNRVN